jgi:hypothetical protein
LAAQNENKKDKKEKERLKTFPVEKKGLMGL